MKKILCALFALAIATTTLAQAPVQKAAPAKKITNRYAMVLKPTELGDYKLASPEKFKFINLDTIPDLLIPYTAKPIASKKEYGACVSEEYTYKKHEGYELKLIVDRAVSEEPTPFVIYIHGGGWTEGNNGAFRINSQFIAMKRGITGVRIAYSLGGQPGANIEVGMQDIADALKWVQEHAQELNIDPTRFAFCGHSAGAHLAALAAMTIKGATAFIGNAGPYDMADAEASAVKFANRKRKDYFFGLKKEAGKRYSPLYHIPKRNIPTALLVHGTGDIQCEYTHSVRFAEALEKQGGKVELKIYPCYDHNLHSQRSDKGREILLLMADFLAEQLKK